MRRIARVISVWVFLLSSVVHAGQGLLFNITSSGSSHEIDFVLCLNGTAALSCQNYKALSLVLSISTTVPNHTYPAVGIKILTPGYTPSGCTAYSNGYCLFTVNDQTPTTIIVTKTIPDTHTVGGMVSGLAGTVVLQNNGSDSLSISGNGSFTFPTSVAEGSPYAVTVQTQPATQTCTVSNGSGTMDGSNVTNVAVICSTNSYTVGGTVSNLVGTVILQNNGGDPLAISGDGSFTFPTSVAEGSPYAVTVQTQPATQTCTVANGSGTMGGGNVTNVTVTCTTNSFTVGGMVSALVGTVVLQNNGSDSLSISASGSFTFPTPVAEGDSYNVTVQTQPTTQTCAVSNGTGIMGGSNVTNVAVTCLTNSYTVGGQVSGLIGTVVLQNNGSDALSISSDNSFTFPTPIAEGSPYTVTVRTQPATQTCTVSNGTGTMGGSNVTNVNVTCATNSFTVGGTVSGLVGTVVLQNNSSDPLSISGSGSFTFPTPIAEGSPYAVTVRTQPATQTCTVTSGTGTMGGSNVTNVTVTCATNSFTVGGTVSGLVGTVVLQDNGSDTLSISSSGSFTFPTPVAEGSPYHVTVQTQPAIQTCTVSNGSGTMGGANVTNVAVACIANTTTLSVSATGTIPVNGGSGTLTITNTGTTHTAVNVHAVLPGAWVAVTQDSSNCTAIAPNGGTCQLSFSSTAAYVAQGSISVTGDNITSPPNTALAFTIDGYLVFSILSASTANVIASSDASTAINWSTNTIWILGITETSTVAAGDACNGATDGICDTQQIVNQYGTPYNTYAAGLCYGITLDNSGTVPVGTWYLPAICQLGRSGQLAGCAAGLANIDTNLVSLGFGGLSAQYWSSTEYANTPTSVSWYEFFNSGTNSFQNNTSKVRPFPVRCARVMSY